MEAHLREEYLQVYHFFFKFNAFYSLTNPRLQITQQSPRGAAATDTLVGTRNNCQAKQKMLGGAERALLRHWARNQFRFSFSSTALLCSPSPCRALKLLMAESYERGSASLQAVSPYSIHARYGKAISLPPTARVKLQQQEMGGHGTEQSTAGQGTSPSSWLHDELQLKHIQMGEHQNSKQYYFQAFP